MMGLVLQETCSSQVLKPWRLDQETSEEKLFIKADRFPIDSLTDISIEVSTDSSTAVSIENYKIRIFRSDFQSMLTCMCKVSFLTTLDIYKTYFKGCHIREYKENTCKKWLSALFSLKEATASLRLRVL